MKQAARSRRMSRANLLPSVLWRKRQTVARLVLRYKTRNRRGDFEAQITKPELPRNSHSSSPCAGSKPHTMSPDFSIVRPSSTQSVLDHHRSCAPGPLLLPRSLSLPVMSHLSPTHHGTSKCDSSHESR
jgi:hypothetical protein